MSPQTSPDPAAQIADVQTRLLRVELQHGHLEEDAKKRLTLLEAKGREYITRRDFHQVFMSRLTLLDEKLTGFIEKQEDKEKQREEKAEKLRDVWIKILVGVVITLAGSGLLWVFSLIYSFLK